MLAREAYSKLTLSNWTSPLSGLGQRNGVLGRTDVRLDGQEFGDAFGGAGGLADLAPHLGKLAERGGGKHRVDDELAEPAARDLAAHHGSGAVPQHRRDADHHQQNDEPREPGAGQHAVARGNE